jgi:hypothetical protein
MAKNELKNLLSHCSEGDLASVIRRARELGQLTDALSRALPEDCAGAIVAANLRADGNLVVIASSSAWASRLRYETDTLLAAARDAGLQPVACRVRVSQS